MQIKNKQSERQARSSSSIFGFMTLTKWLSMFLLFALGAAEIYLQHSRDMAINWAFAMICFICGILVFWIGHSLFAPERRMRRRIKRCRKVVRNRSEGLNPVNT